MFINNIKNFACKKIKCEVELGNYLIKVGFPLLGREGEYMIFANTSKIKEAIKEYMKGVK